MKIKTLETLENVIINEVVEVHMSSFQGFFLTFLGRGFLRQLYQGFVEHHESGLIIAQNDEHVIGFLAYSRNLSAFYKFLIKKHLFVFAFYSMGGFVRNPTIFFRLLRALKYSKEVKREENYIELSSIGVQTSYENFGIGSQLIAEFKRHVMESDAEYIKLETDADNNEKANRFYQKNGFELENTYETPEKRKMNEYRFYLHRE